MAEKNVGRKIILQANTIENADKNFGSRHIVKSLGGCFEDFNFQEFEKTCREINESPLLSDSELIDIDTAVKVWNKPTPFNSSLGRINRCDGCSWLMSKSDWEVYGPLPVIRNGITGDVIIHDRLQSAGYQSYIVKNCITYHFVQGGG